MDLALLDDTLAAAGEPAFRARQVWSWAARGATGYEQMTDLPAALRSRLHEALPLPAILPEETLRTEDNQTVKTLYRTRDNERSRWIGGGHWADRSGSRLGRAIRAHRTGEAGAADDAWRLEDVAARSRAAGHDLRRI